MAIMGMQSLQRTVLDVLAVNVVPLQQFVTTPLVHATVNPMLLENTVTAAR